MSGDLWILKTGATLPEIAVRRGDFEDWIRDAMGCACRVANVVEGDALPDPTEAKGIVVTGSGAFVSDCEAWSERTARWLARAADAGTPLLGICYGHQLLAHALGGRVGRNPLGREIGTVEVSFDAANDPLLGPLPTRAPLHATHVESVLELPRAAVRLASNSADPNHAFRYGECAWGVQFHPEFDADVMRAYLEGRRELLVSEGLDPDALLSRVTDAPEGPALLRRFASLFGGA